MVAAPLHRPRSSPSARRIGRGPVVAVAVLAPAVPTAVVPRAAGQNPEGKKDGLFIPVANPITDAVVSQVEAKVADALKRRAGSLRTLVFDFTPNDQPTNTSKIGPCLDLMEYIR